MVTVSALSHGAVGDRISDKYTAEGVNRYNGLVYLTSDRFYDSAKQNYTGASPDSLMCWLHSSANSIQYWQTYYGVFATSEIPYGSRESASLWSEKVTQLQVADTMREYFRNQGEDFATATEWYMRGEILNSGAMKTLGGGGYYSDYFGTDEAYVKYDVKGTDMNTLTHAVYQAFGIEQQDEHFVQAEAGLIPLIGIAYKDSNGNEYGHSISCYGFTTDSSGNIDMLYLTDPDKVNGNPMDIAYVGKSADGQLVLYSDAGRTTPLAYDSNGNTWFIRNVWHIDTPEVLQNMLAEYSDMDEAQVWNGKNSAWEAQTATTEELPTEATGWDVHINGDHINTKHHNYYHTYATEGRKVEFGTHAEENARTVTINGTVSSQEIAITAAGYRFIAGESAAIAPGADMVISNGATLHSELELQLKNLSMEAGTVLSANSPIVVTGEFNTLKSIQEAATFSVRAAATAEETELVRIEADLDLRAATEITLETTVDLDGHHLFLSENAPITLSTDSISGGITFFTGINELYVGNTKISGSNIVLNNYLNIDGNEANETPTLVFNNGSITMSIPEPTTTSLGLMALMALAARRRRAS